MLTKREVIEMIYRPCPMKQDTLERLISKCMAWENQKLITEFTNSTKISIEYAGGNLFKLNYS